MKSELQNYLSREDMSEVEANNCLVFTWPDTVSILAGSLSILTNSLSNLEISLEYGVTLSPGPTKPQLQHKLGLFSYFLVAPAKAKDIGVKVQIGWFQAEISCSVIWTLR